LDFWFKDDLKEYVNDTLLSKNSKLSSYLDKKYVSEIIQKNQNGKKDFSSRIWPLIIFEEWLKQKG
jgi:asparagine synthetase B (glutamine-hydrolysing)